MPDHCCLGDPVSEREGGRDESTISEKMTALKEVCREQGTDQK